MQAYKKWSWSILIIGAALRTVQYLYNRSLWTDEATLALNIVNKNFHEFFFPLDYEQGAPIGFLIIEKLAISFLGNHDYILRLFPFLCSLISLILFFSVAQWFIKQKMIPLALCFFSLSYHILYYATECKQYSSDVAITLLLYATIIHVVSSGYRLSQILILGLISNIAIWLSHPSLFIIAGSNIVILLRLLKDKKNKKSAHWFLFLCSLEMINFLVLYSVSLRTLFDSTHLVILEGWTFAYMPFPPRSPADFKWFISNFFGIFKHPGGLLPSLSVFPFFIGCITMVREKNDNFLLLALPLFLTLLASGLHLFPFSGRLILFIVPILLLWITKGIEKISEYSSIVGVALTAAMLCFPILSATRYLMYPRTKEEIKPIMAYLKKNKRPEDIIYLQDAAKFSFQYYSNQYGFQKSEYVTGEGKDLKKFQGRKRFWIVFSHVESIVYNKKYLTLLYLDTIGKKLDSFIQTGTEVYLYDLSKIS